MLKNYLWECTINDYRDINDTYLTSQLSKYHVFESAHITNIFDSAVEGIYSIIISHYQTYKRFPKILNPITTGIEFYTGWNLVPNRNTDEEPYVINAKDRMLDYPIYIRFYMNQDETDTGYTKYRKMLEDEIKDGTKTEFYKDKILISINAYLFELNEFEEKDIFEAVFEETIAHEMQHAYDMYHFPDFNILDSKKNSLLNDFRENAFSFIKTSPDYQFLDDMCYFLSRPEVRGRLKGYSTFLDKFKHTKKRIMNLVADVNRMLPANYFNNCTKEQKDEKIHKFLTMCVLHDLKVSDCILLKSYNVHVYQLLMDKYPQTDIYLIVLGYYMHKHKYFKFNTKVINDYHIESERIRKFFSFDNIKNYIMHKILLYGEDIFDDVLFLIKFQIESEYLRYYNLIYNETNNKLKDLFDDLIPDDVDIIDDRLTKRKYFELRPIIPKLQNREWFYEDVNIINHQAIYEKLDNMVKNLPIK